MQYLLTFLEGLASFISPCLLPMIPLYLSYFAGSDDEEENAQTNETADENIVAMADENVVATADENEEKVAENGVATADVQPKKAEQVKKRKINGKVIVRALSFVLGFTLMFVFFGGLVGLVGGFLTKYKTVVNIVAGIIVIIFGLSYVGLFNLPLFKGLKKARKADTVFSAFLFGIVFSVGVGPCTGAFLGSALALASTSGTVVKGVLLLLCYSLGLGIPFVLAALLTDKLKRLFTFIKKHYKVIKIVSGSLLIVMGILLAAGVMDKLGAILA